MFKDTSRDDIFIINNPEFEKYIPDIYWNKKKMQLKILFVTNA